MQKTPKGLRLHIGIFGRRNAGKSSFLNALTKQEVSIVSDKAGTTTDPVEKPMELLPIGPVLFIDTAGIDDEGALGELRVRKTKEIFERVDVAVIVAEASKWGIFENNLIDEFKKRNIPLIIVFNKTDIVDVSEKLIEDIKKSEMPFIRSVATQGIGICEFRELLIKIIPQDFMDFGTIVGDIVPPGEMAVLVVPIDFEAPKGRLILPQVQTIRDLLDNDSFCMVVKERELREALDRLKKPPAIVITDSQAFLKVSGDVPEDILLTSFSILFARYKGDLDSFVEGAMSISHLKTGDRILVAESCSHHPICEDIGRVKIPRWLTQFVGGKLEFTHVQGHDFPENLNGFKLVIHCGGCVFNRRELLSRILKCREQNVPITNYGIAISYSLGIFERALLPFPSARELIKRKNKQEQQYE